MTDQDYAEAIETYRTGLVSYTLARGYAATRDRAEDIVQDVLTAVWARGAHVTFRGDSSVYTWLCQCVHQRAIDLLRERTTMARQPDQAGYVQALDELRATEGLVARARELVSTVTDSIVREALELWLDGCEWEEIALIVDTPPSTVRRWVRETMEELEGVAA